MPDYPENLQDTIASSWWPAALFLAMLLVTMIAEQLWPRFAPVRDPEGRTLANVTLGILTLGVQVVTPFMIAAVAAPVQASFGGLLPLLGIGGWTGFVLSMLVVSLAYYLVHVLFHRVPIFWRLHLVHHADTRLDIMTGFRHHPVEPVAALLFVGPVIVLFGLDPAATFFYAMLALLGAIFQHADLNLPRTLDRVLCWVFATPNFHHVHHSALRKETDSNYGEVFTFWDRIFRTYIVPGIAPPDRIGLGERHDPNAHDVRAQLWGRPDAGTNAGNDRAATESPPS